MRLILFAFASAIFVASGFQAQALTLSNESIPYYGQDFYNEVHKGDRDAALIEDIRTVLTKKHQRNPNGMDTIVDQCQGDAAGCYEQTPIGYTTARKVLLGKLFLVPDGANYGIKEVYCGRTYVNADFSSGNKPGPDVVPDEKILNIEHTWPQSRFSKKFPAEVQKCDLHHLFPSDSKLNAIRGNFWFGEVDHEKQALKCGESKFGTWNGKGQFFEPPAAHKGNVARALLYFSLRYQMPIDQDEEALLKKWNKEDPVDADERARNDEIEKIQGNRNPFVDFPELADQIADF
jgi:deoxyribonuclease-1